MSETPTAAERTAYENAKQFATDAEKLDTAEYTRVSRDTTFGSGTVRVYVGVTSDGNSDDIQELARELGADSVEFLGGLWEVEATFTAE